MLDLYISERVKELIGNRQMPVTVVPNGVPDFPVALVKLGRIPLPPVMGAIFRKDSDWRVIY